MSMENLVLLFLMNKFIIKCNYTQINEYLGSDIAQDDVFLVRVGQKMLNEILKYRNIKLFL